MRKLSRLPVVWLGVLSAILLALNYFGIVPFAWATAPLWILIVAVCGIAGCAVGIAACFVMAIVGICIGLVVLVCALILFLVVAAAGLFCAGTMYFMFGGRIAIPAIPAIPPIPPMSRDSRTTA